MPWLLKIMLCQFLEKEIYTSWHWLRMTKESLEMLTSLLAIGYPLLGQEGALLGKPLDVAVARRT